MSTASIQDVSDTALMTAVYRAIESARPDALFRDPLAGRLAGERGRQIVAGLSKSSGLTCWSVALRTCIIDDFIQSAIRQGVDTVLNLGAGLDTRPYRMTLPESLIWIEADYPRIIELKETRLMNETPACNLERIRLDLADRPARRELFSKIGSSTHKALVLTEGVIPYLHTDEAASLADDLYSQPTFNYWITDYFSPDILRLRGRSAVRRDLKRAPWHFQPGDYYGFFQQHGWQTSQVRYYHDEAQRLRRPAPLPLIKKSLFMLRYLFASRERREMFRKSAGYVLFERIPFASNQPDR